VLYNNCRKNLGTTPIADGFQLTIPNVTMVAICSGDQVTRRFSVMPATKSSVRFPLWLGAFATRAAGRTCAVAILAGVYGAVGGATNSFFVMPATKSSVRFPLWLGAFATRAAGCLRSLSRVSLCRLHTRNRTVHLGAIPRWF
ncbi:MAG: hypothetical protein RR297_08380, partial [Clostridia bacterium]